MKCRSSLRIVSWRYGVCLHKHSNAWLGPALLLGGFIWILTDGFVIMIGVQTGKLVGSPSMPPSMLAQIGVWFLPVSVLVLGFGLSGLFARLEGRAKGLGITGIVFVSLGMIMSLINLVLLSGVVGNMTHLSNLMGGFGPMFTTIGTAFLGWAYLRAQLLPRWLGWLLIVIGLITIPILFTTPLPIGPDWATDFLAFLLSGIAYAVVGAKLPAAHQPVAANSMSASANAAAPAK